MNRLFVRKKNNKGSTLIIVIVVVALIAILATTTLSAAMLNYRMKIVGSESKKSFYTAEEAVDQLYACFGMLTMNNLNIAYTDQMATITRQDASGSSYIVSNENCNTELRLKFAKKTIKDLFSVDTWAPTGGANKVEIDLSGDTPIVVDNVRALMNSYIEDYDASNPIISVKSVGDCSIIEEPSDVHANLYNYKVEIDDIAIEYKNEQGYFANVTVDADIALPDMLIAFTEVSESALMTFGDYAIIGYGGVDVPAAKSLKLAGAKLYAGPSYGLKIGANANVETAEGMAAGVNRGATINTPGAVTLSGEGVSDTNRTKFTIDSKSKLWCLDLKTDSSSKWAEININGTAFVKDDLDVDGQFNNVNVTGNYAGFQFEGFNSNSRHDLSSAMMLNGKYCNLNMSGINSLILGGRSYVMYNSSGYMTGEAVSLRANQEVYLVPDTFIKDKDTTKTGIYYSNPVTNPSKVKVEIPDNFFAEKMGYLDETNPVTTVTVGAFTYYYFNIKNDKSSEFINAIVDYNPANGVDVYIEAMRRVLFADILELQQQSLLTTKSGSMIYSNGSMINAQLNATGTDVESLATSTNTSIDHAAFSLTASDFKSRFTLINTVLYEPEFFTDKRALTGSDLLVGGDRTTAYLNPPSTIIVDGKNIDIQAMLSEKNVFKNFINSDVLPTMAPFTAQSADGFKVYCSGNATNINLSDSSINITDGLVITRGDVEVSADFNGLIFTEGKVKVNGQITVTNTYGDINAMLNKLSAEDKATVQSFFRAWGGTEVSEPDSALDYNIGGITYKHIIDFNNWRKSAPTIIDGEGETESTSAAAGVPEVGL